MARKVKEPREIILEGCEGSRQGTPFFKSLSDDAFVGYQTAAVKILNPNIPLNAQEVYELIYQMLKNGEI